MSKSTRFAVSWGVTLACGFALLLAIGYLAPQHQIYALAAGCVAFVIGASMVNPMVLPLVSMVTLVVIERVGGDALNLSLSDAVLFAAFWVAVIFAPRPFSRPMRAMLWLSFTYQVASLFTVVANPYRANLVEWFHAWLLVGGAMVVGWAVARSGYARLATYLFLIPCAGMTVLVFVYSARLFAATGQYGPVFLSWPWGMHKNFIGCVLGFAAVVAYARPVWLRLPHWVAWTIFWSCAAAITLAQARQAMVGLGIAVVFICLRPDPDVRRSKLILLPIVLGGLLVSTMVQDQLDSGNQFNSAFQRLTWYEQAVSVWQQNPWFGVGLRWWVSGRTQFAFQPPNAELEVLTSVGLVGLAGFLILMLGGLLVLWRVDRRYGTLAFALLLSRLVQGQFDLFWVSVQVSVPFVIIGICLGAQAYDQSERRKRQLRKQRLQQARATARAQTPKALVA